MLPQIHREMDRLDAGEGRVLVSHSLRVNKRKEARRGVWMAGSAPTFLGKPCAGGTRGQGLGGH